MRRMGYIIAKIRSKLHRKKEYQIVCNYFRRRGAHIGDGCIICSNLDLCEEQLLTIGEKTIISSEVSFITHDVSISLASGQIGSLFGRITIGSNCFIGKRSTIMYGVTIGNNNIVGAGSVVTKSFKEDGVIIAGNPAKVIGKTRAFSEKYGDRVLTMNELFKIVNESDDLLTKKLIIK